VQLCIEGIERFGVIIFMYVMFALWFLYILFVHFPPQNHVFDRMLYSGALLFFYFFIFIYFFFWAARFSFCVGQFLFLWWWMRMIIHMLPWRSNLEWDWRASTNHGVNQVRELNVHLWCWSTSSIFQKSVSKHAHCRIRKWMNLGFTTSPLGPQHTHAG
jgi:hypothetical protein